MRNARSWSSNTSRPFIARNKSRSRYRSNSPFTAENSAGRGGPRARHERKQPRRWATAKGQPWAVVMMGGRAQRLSQWNHQHRTLNLFYGACYGRRRTGASSRVLMTPHIKVKRSYVHTYTQTHPYMSRGLGCLQCVFLAINMSSPFLVSLYYYVLSCPCSLYQYVLSCSCFFSINLTSVSLLVSSALRTVKSYSHIYPIFFVQNTISV